MNNLKSYDRFAHAGVKRHLTQLRNHSVLQGLGLEFGSSGEGELTIRSRKATAYARKYKSRDGWKLVFCTGAKIDQTVFTSELRETASRVRACLS